MDTIEYLPDETPVRDAPIQGRQQTSNGYGQKLPTSQQALYKGRWYRVYCTIFSNAGSLWIMAQGRKLFLRS